MRFYRTRTEPISMLRSPTRYHSLPHRTAENRTTEKPTAESHTAESSHRGNYCGHTAALQYCCVISTGQWTIPRSPLALHLDEDQSGYCRRPDSRTDRLGISDTVQIPCCATLLESYHIQFPFVVPAATATPRLYHFISDNYDIFVNNVTRSECIAS